MLMGQRRGDSEVDRGTVKNLMAVGAVVVGAIIIASSFLSTPDNHEVKTGGYLVPQESDAMAGNRYFVPPGSMLKVLETIPVKGRASATGYQRGMFGRAWTDDVDVEFGHNGCDTRSDILHRDLADVTTDKKRCRVLSGVLHDPYTGNDIPVDRRDGTFILIQIDHIVPLKDAWQKGAQEWDARKRVQFANDPLNLLAVGHQANKGKRDSDVATWLPEDKSFRCYYVARVVQVKARYGLWMTQPEHDVAVRVLEKCSASS